MSAIDRSFIKVFTEPPQPETSALPATPPAAIAFDGRAAHDSRAAADFLAAIASLAQISAAGSPADTTADTAKSSIRIDPAPATANVLNPSTATDAAAPSAPTAANSVPSATPDGAVELARGPSTETTNHRFSTAHTGTASGPHWNQHVMPTFAVSVDANSSEMPSASIDHSETAPSGSAAVHTPPPARGATFARPAFEVDRFDKPQVCRQLFEAASDGVRATANHICDAAAHGQNVILVTGYHRGEGRTTTALCLATELAARNKSVVVVDADFESPKLAKTVGIAPQLGWEDSILDGMPISDMMIESLEDGYTILPLTAGTTPHFDWTVDSKLPAVLEGVRDHFDVVIVDGMPAETYGHAATLLDSLGPFVDFAIVLHTGFDDAGEELTRVVSRLLGAGIEPLGVIRNAPPMRSIA